MWCTMDKDRIAGSAKNVDSLTDTFAQPPSIAHAPAAKAKMLAMFVGFKDMLNCYTSTIDRV